MRRVIDVEDLLRFVEKYRILYEQKRVLSPDNLEYIFEKLFIQRGFWLEIQLLYA